jgi:hypothetical protein
MSFCDFSEDVEDAIDAGNEEVKEETKQDAPQLLWLSDIPLFQSIRPMKPGGHSYLAEEDNDAELSCTYMSSRVAYRDVADGVAYRDVADGVGEEGNSDESDTEWADTSVNKPAIVRDEFGNPIRRLEDTPDWFERYSSFLCQKDPDYILAILKEMLERDDRIVFEIPEGDYQIRGMVYLQDSPTHFHINIYRDLNGEFLVEYQRQGGCMMDFQTLYRQSLSHLNSLKDVLVAPIQATSSGTFNFTMPTDKTATAAPYTSLEDLKTLRDAMEECEKRFVSQLEAVRDEALRNLLRASINVGYLEHDDDIIRLFDILLYARRDLPTRRIRMGTEMGRCIATISNNLCAAKIGLTEEEQMKHNFFLYRVAREVVPQLLIFWENEHSSKCVPRRKETDKQIAQLLGLFNVELFKDEHFDMCAGHIKLMTGHINLMEKKIDIIREHIDKDPKKNANYNAMHAYLSKIVAYENERNYSVEKELATYCLTDCVGPIMEYM